MYTEEPKNEINWGSIFKKGIIIVIIIALMFLIFWLLIKNNNNSQNINVNNSEGNNSSLNESYYTNDFISNYRYFHDTAKEYFLVTELPENGRTVKYTLKELIDKGLILAFGYENKACDLEASYVLVTNDNGTYKFTTTLVCGKEVAKTTEELGCNQLCPSGNCSVGPETIQPNKPSTTDKYITEYEYKQAYTEDSPVYSCPKGYTKTGDTKNDKCIKDDSKSVAATEVVNYKCPSGYTPSGSGKNTKCTKTNTKTVNATVTITYTCPDSSYIPVEKDGKTKCYKKTDIDIPALYNEIPQCPYGYDLVPNGNKNTCVKTTSYNYPALTISDGGGCPNGYSPVTSNGYTYCIAYTSNLSKCPSGYTKVGSGASATCRSTVAATVKCPSGYHVSGSGSSATCVIDSPKAATKNVEYYCGSTKVSKDSSCKTYRTKAETLYLSSNYGDSYQGCEKQTSYPTPCNSGTCTGKTYVYYCPAKTSYTLTKPTEKVSYTCPSGWTKTGSGSSTKCSYSNKNYLTTTCSNGAKPVNNTCTVDNSSLLQYYCPAGYTPNGTGKNMTCSKTEEYMIEIQTYCPTGIEMGDQCVVVSTDFQAPTYTRNYYCPDNTYNLYNNRCYKTTEDIKDTAIAHESYSCKEGKIDGKKCIITTTETAKPITTTTYTCPSKEYNLNGKVCTIGKVDTKDLIVTYDKVTKYRYQWSSKTSIEGWTKTGNTRKVKASSK